ncbi:zf-HC2 domain-containing protein [Duganella vulcania]|uniref:Zf-HC2 domain-containing protein n=1 Tax=Duganella vulcania TaxID=2692166 RepID=A0A845GTQ2_9BURK|nr:zf-HC2 domain-containing protein [Duganella vulcania]MYM96047.1 zf-HC2 domain-containing protein [Duganella vulcania]
MEPHKTGLKPTCREVHRLVSEGMDRDLSFVERTRMRLHLMVCDACTRFNGQMSLLRTAMRRFPLDVPEDGVPPLDDDPEHHRP